MTLSSHDDLHPTHGARFLAELVADDPLAYAVTVFLPEAARLVGDLRWPDGRAEITPAWPDPWATDEVLKLARVLRRTPKARLVRWRARPAAAEPAPDNS
jgi:hypothetical protein